MSFRKTALYGANPSTARGTSTKLSSTKDGKIVYVNGKTVLIRDLKDPSRTISYSGHVHTTTVARISPSGYYCASADASGMVKVWDTIGEDQAVKGDYKVLGGCINDLSWDGESKRIIAVGNSQDKFGHAFMMDTGSSTGEITGHSKVVNAVSIRYQRPFRAVTAGDDNQIIFHEGPPYKYSKSIKTHTKFVQDVKYAPSGDYFASVGSDYKIFTYDGKTGDTLFELTDSPHKGSIMACCWSPDSRSLITSSADCTVKLWDVEARKATTTWTIGTGVDNQQVGNTWSGEQDIVSLSLSGALNIFDRRTGDKPVRVLSAPQNSITSSAPATSDTFYTGTADGRVYSYSALTSEATTISGQGHSNFVSGIASSPSDNKLYSIGFDDHVRVIDISQNNFLQGSVGTSKQPKGIAILGDSTVFVAEIELLEAFRSNQKLYEIKPKFVPSAVAASGSILAIGGEDQKVYLNEWDGKALKEIAVLEGNKALISALAFSPDGKLLASGDSSGRISLFDVTERKLITSRWSFHSARIISLAWTPDGRNCASGSLDTHVYVWSVAKPLRNIAIKNAQPGGANAVLWLADNKLVSAGADGCVRVWDITFHSDT